MTVIIGAQANIPCLASLMYEEGAAEHGMNEIAEARERH